MTRDQWLQQCAQRFMDRSDADAGSAAAYAKECAAAEQQAHGSEPRNWTAPADAADEEMSYWDDDTEAVA